MALWSAATARRSAQLVGAQRGQQYGVQLRAAEAGGAGGLRARSTRCSAGCRVRRW